MNNRKRDKNRRARLSLQNRDLVRNQLNLVIENMGLNQEEQEVTEEEDPLKFFSQQARKKEKEEEAKKYLHPIAEEEDPLKFFDKDKNEELEEDPLKFVKNNEEETGEAQNATGNLNLALHDESKLIEAIKNNDIPEEIVVNKKTNERSTSEDRQKRLKKKLNTALRFSQKVNILKRFNEKLLNRVKNEKKIANAEETIKKSNEPGKNKEGGNNTLLAADEQIDPTKNNQTVTQTKDVDLKNFMGDKPKKDGGN